MKNGIFEEGDQCPWCELDHLTVGEHGPECPRCGWSRAKNMQLLAEHDQRSLPERRDCRP